MPKKGYGHRIRAARSAKGWSQRELADRLGTSESTISNLEREQHPPTVPEQVNSLCVALSLSPELLLADMGVELPPPAAARLPRSLVRDLLSLPPDDLANLAGLTSRLARVTRSQGEPSQ